MSSTKELYPADYTPKTILKHMYDYNVEDTRTFNKAYATDKKNLEKYLSYCLDNEAFSYIITSSLRIKSNPIIFETFSNRAAYNLENPYPNPYYRLEGNRIAIKKSLSKTDYILLDYTVTLKHELNESETGVKRVTYSVDDIYKGGATYE